MTRELVRKNATDFFRGLLRDALSEQRVEASEDAEFYLVKLLEGFIRADQSAFNRPLALDYLEALEGGPPVRYRKLKHVGDTALFVAGIFLESLERKLVGADYYTSLGGLAYHHLATTSGTPLGTAVTGLFTEMSVRFPDFVRVLSQMSLQELFRSDQDTLRIYRRWLATRGARDAQVLVRRGLIPVAPRRTTLQ
jgi:hypothetical protein